MNDMGGIRPVVLLTKKFLCEVSARILTIIHIEYMSNYVFNMLLKEIMLIYLLDSPTI